MSVVCEAINVVVRVDKLNERFPGGLTGYVGTVPNLTFCSDGVLSRVAFMHPDDVRLWLTTALVPHRLSLDPTTGLSDACVVVDQFKGPTMPCPWIEHAQHEGGYSYCWLAGSDPGEMATPAGWQPSNLVAWGHSELFPGLIEASSARPRDPTKPIVTARPLSERDPRAADRLLNQADPTRSDVVQCRSCGADLLLSALLCWGCGEKDFGPR